MIPFIRHMRRRRRALNFDGRIFVRVPRELHQKLAILAEYNGVDIDQYVTYLLSSNKALIDSNPAAELSAEAPSLVKPREKRGRKPKMQPLAVVPASEGKKKEGGNIGRTIGKAIAEKLGIELESASNKGVYHGKSVVIKSARIGNTLFGVTNKMLSEIEEIILAKETANGQFELYLVAVSAISGRGWPTGGKSGGVSRVTNFSVNDAIAQGELFDTISIEVAS